MAEYIKLYYKTCRENAGLTQDEACYHLGIADTTTLSKYENGHLKIDSALIKKMALLYRNKKLPLWHIRYTNPELAEFIPDPTELNNDYELVMQSEYLTDMSEEIYLKFKDFLRDGTIDENEREKIRADVPKIERLINQYTSIKNYIEKLM